MSKQKKALNTRKPEEPVDMGEWGEEDTSWICTCGHFQDHGSHCDHCGPGHEPPWGCPCVECRKP